MKWWCDYGMDKVMCSVQSSLLFLYYAVFSVMSVQYCLCVSRIHAQCTQCSVSVYSVGSSSVQSAIASVQFLKHVQGRVCSTHSQWRSVLAGLQSTAFMVCLQLFSV